MEEFLKKQEKNLRDIKVNDRLIEIVLLQIEAAWLGGIKEEAQSVLNKLRKK